MASETLHPGLNLKVSNAAFFTFSNCPSADLQKFPTLARPLWPSPAVPLPCQISLITHPESVDKNHALKTSTNAELAAKLPDDPSRLTGRAHRPPPVPAVSPPPFPPAPAPGLTQVMRTRQRTCAILPLAACTHGTFLVLAQPAAPSMSTAAYPSSPRRSRCRGTSRHSAAAAPAACTRPGRRRPPARRPPPPAGCCGQPVQHSRRALGAGTSPGQEPERNVFNPPAQPLSWASDAAI